MTTRNPNDMPEEELQNKQRREHLDNADNSGIMTTEGQKNDIRNDLQPGRTQNQSSRLLEREQKERNQANAGSGDSGMGGAEGNERERTGRKPDGDRGQPGRSLESGDQVSHSGERERLGPSDIILSRQSSIGHDAGAAARFDANLSALRTLKNIEDERRHATKEEQEVLSKYSGFGDSGFGEAFPRYESTNFKNAACQHA